MKLQTTCASDKAAHINVSVKERVSSEMSISTQRGEIGGQRVDEKREEKAQSIRERSHNQNMGA